MNFSASALRSSGCCFNAFGVSTQAVQHETSGYEVTGLGSRPVQQIGSLDAAGVDGFGCGLCGRTTIRHCEHRDEK